MFVPVVGNKLAWVGESIELIKIANPTVVELSKNEKCETQMHSDLPWCTCVWTYFDYWNMSISLVFLLYVYLFQLYVEKILHIYGNLMLAINLRSY